MSHIVLYRDVDNSEIAVDEPLTDNINFDEVVADLGIPSYVDLRNQSIKIAMSSIWAANNSVKLFGDASRELRIKGSLSPLLFGGIAVKMLCPSANIDYSPFDRSIGDVDFVATSRDANKIVSVLVHMHKKLGTRYYFFLTPQDKSFNALRGGRRYRVRMLDAINNGNPIVKDVDIFSDNIELRHLLIFDDEFKLSRENLWTIGAEKLLLSKVQGIMEIDETERGYLDQAGQTFRILDYPYYRTGKIIIGVEWKDMIDTCSLLHDCVNESGNNPKIDPHRIVSVLRKNKKFALTARLNLSNILHNEDFLRSKGLTSPAVSRIMRGAQLLLDTIPDPNKKWSKPWWNEDVDTPIVS